MVDHEVAWCLAGGGLLLLDQRERVIEQLELAVARDVGQNGQAGVEVAGEFAEIVCVVGDADPVCVNTEVEDLGGGRSEQRPPSRAQVDS